MSLFFFTVLMFFAAIGFFAFMDFMCGIWKEGRDAELARKQWEMDRLHEKIFGKGKTEGDKDDVRNDQ